MASIDVTQGQLQEQGEESVVSLDGNLETLKDVWRDASQDCVLIQDWLRNGQQVAVSLRTDDRKHPTKGKGY